MAAERENLLLQSLTPADLALLQPHLAEVALPLRSSVEEPNKPIPSVYFPLSCLISVVATGHSGRTIEVGIVGREGMTGMPILTGSDQSPRHTFTQVAGTVTCH